MSQTTEKYRDYDELLKKIENFKGLEGINQQIQSELESAKRTITALNKKVSMYSSTDSIIASLKEQNIAIKEELEMKRISSKGTIDNLNGKMEGMQTEIVALTRECNEYKQNMEGFKSNIDELNEQIVELRTNTNREVVQSAKLTQENESFQEQLSTLKVLCCVFFLLLVCLHFVH